MKRQLSATQQKLLEKLLALPEKDRFLAPTIPRQPRLSRYPLSFSQWRFWITSQLELDTPAYVIVRAFRLTGKLDIAVLERSLAELVKRHSGLRTTFQEEEDGPVQVIAEKVESFFSQIDLTSMKSASRNQALAELLREQLQVPFDLQHGPLVRFVLAGLGEQEYALLVALHHIVTDDWSTQILFRELSVFYSNLISGQSSPLPETPIEYTDFAVWQRQLIQQERLSRQVAYWKQQLAGITSPLNLSTKTRPVAPSLSCTRLSVPLPQKLWEGIQDRCRASNTTLFEVLLTAFGLLLAYYTGEDDIAVATVISNRDRPELEPLVGCLINTVVLRIKLADDPTLAVVLKQVRESMLDAQNNKDVPFEHLLSVLDADRSDSSVPLTRVLFALQNANNACLSLPGINVEPIAPELGTSTFDLTLAPEQTAGGLNIVLLFNTTLFEVRMAHRLIAHYCSSLEALVTNPEQRSNGLLLLTTDERKQLQIRDRVHADRILIPDLFEIQAARTPDAMAVAFGFESVSYRELNSRANQLAAHLIRLGARAETRVAICLERGSAMITALLGILKAGAAYVPLDPGYPAERLSYILQDSASQILLTQDALLSQLPSFSGKVVLLDGHWEEITRHSSQNLARAIYPKNLAYIIYTSGSTGKPKGVSITHASAAMFIAWAREVFSAEELSGVLASTSLCFDLSVFEIFVPLSSGGSIVVVENGLGLAMIAADKPVTLVNTVPSIMRELVRMNAIAASVQTIALAGEALSIELVRAIHAASPARVLNLYGPSESTTYSTYACLLRNNDQTVPIGKAITNTEVYVLNRWLQPLPENVTGELYIGGEGLARGYLDRADLTAERFLPNAFSTIPGERLYRTGDLVRLMPDGNLEFLGRRDDQVKVRGYRIELGEIESALEGHDSVDQAAVAVHEDERGEKRLVAYLVGTSKEQSTLNDLSQYLKSRLPQYMVPDSVVWLQSLPLTANGKIDRRRLRNAGAGVSLQTDSVLTLEEETLCKLWTEVLQSQPIGVNQDFFTLGGDSLLALRIGARARKIFGIELPLRVFFEARTVRGLAEYIVQQRGEEQELETLMNILQFELHQKQSAS